LDPETLSRLGKVARPDWFTAETGAGISTILCSACVRRHFVVCPNPAEIARIREFLVANSLPDQLVPLLGSSESALPSLAQTLGGQLLDLALIDGAHYYPFPILDWYYFSQVLRVDGWMLVDDIQIPSVGVLVEYLKQDDNWRLDEVTGKTAWFRKLRNEVLANEWSDQSINRNLSTAGHAIPSFAKLRELIGLKFKHAIRRRWNKIRPQRLRPQTR
jgi:hypothetical protein